MRLRKKKNLDLRLEKCKDVITQLDFEKPQYGTEPQKNLIDLSALFGNGNPVQMEIGCGKGQFILQLAKKNPNINFIAVEINSSVIVQACEKIKAAGLQNVRFFILGAQYLDLFIPPNSIDLIYLNFSCPFPKKRHAKHRLTYSSFLHLYKTLLKPNGEIHQKTDNMHFFEFSIEQFSQNGYALKDVSLDLHASGFEGNIVTEYEKRFSDLGQPIYRLVAYIPGN